MSNSIVRYAFDMNPINIVNDYQDLTEKYKGMSVEQYRASLRAEGLPDNEGFAGIDLLFAEFEKSFPGQVW